MPVISDNLQQIIEFISANRDRIATNLRLSDVLEDNIVDHLDMALQEELSSQPYQQARTRAAPINVGKKIINKLSSLYNEPANRDLPNSTDGELWKYYADSMELDVNMADANLFYNTHKYTLLEPYVSSDKTPKLRVIPADRFLVWSSPMALDPNSPDVFIKFMGSYAENKGRFQLWSNEEHVTVDIGQEKNAKNQVVNSASVVDMEENPYGVAPFIYITKSKYSLMPAPDQALFDMTLLVPLLITDLNLISKFQAYSMLYTIDVDVNNIQYGPSNIYNFKSDTHVGSKPQVGSLSPKADIVALGDSVLNQLSMFLETRNLRTTSAGQSGDNSTTGIALLIRNIDTTEDRKAQSVVFKRAEQQLLSLISTYMHPVWTSTGKISDLRQFSPQPTMLLQFNAPEPLVTEQERVSTALLKRDNGLSTQRMALVEVHPELTAQDIDVLAEKIESEKNDVIQFQPIDVAGSDGDSESDKSTEGGDSSSSSDEETN